MLCAKEAECVKLAEEQDRLVTQLAEQTEHLQTAQREVKTKETDLLAEFEDERSAWVDKEAQLTAGCGSIEEMVDGTLPLFPFFELPASAWADHLFLTYVFFIFSPK